MGFVGETVLCSRQRFWASNFFDLESRESLAIEINQLFGWYVCCLSFMSKLSFSIYSLFPSLTHVLYFSMSISLYSFLPSLMFSLYFCSSFSLPTLYSLFDLISQSPTIFLTEPNPLFFLLWAIIRKRPCYDSKVDMLCCHKRSHNETKGQWITSHNLTSSLFDSRVFEMLLVVVLISSNIRALRFFLLFQYILFYLMYVCVRELFLYDSNKHKSISL